MLKTILIANRGEIAVRIIRACRSLNFRTIAVYSDIDVNSLHVKMADEAYSLGNDSIQDTYLNIDKIINIAMETNSDAIHPGYGFLSESAKFAEEVEKKGMIFVGPSSKILHKLGDKVEAKKLAEEVGLETLPYSSTYVETIDEAEKIAKEIGFPILIKAAFGGGGRGMEIVESPETLESSFNGCQTIAERYFGRKEVFIEKFILSPKHIEIQFLTDNFGNAVHLGDRECSIQRAHQKIIEEAPSFVSEEIRKELGKKICNLARNINYTNAGTAEFLWKEDIFYFNEINPRIQVEHPITEMITGIDIIVQQLKIANGEKLSFSQEDISISGHALEFRINAEDPMNEFYPQTGKILGISVPEGKGIRFDTFLYPNYDLPNKFDSLIGKLIVKGDTREEAIKKSLIALEQLEIAGLVTNISLHKSILETPEFLNRSITTEFLRRYKIVQAKNTAVISNQEMQKKKSIRREVEILAPIPGKIAKVLVKEGQNIVENQELIILEAMKMRNRIFSPKDGEIKEILIQENEAVIQDQLLLVLLA